MKKVAVGMSGGIDSAVTAHLLKEKGYEVIGVTMICHNYFSDLEDAKNVCKMLNIDHYTIDLRESFSKYVLSKFNDYYLKGMTPNPCIICNKYIKYGEFLEKSLELGADYFATGHYAKVVFEDNVYKLKKAKNDKKNQAYLLHMLDQTKLSKLILPLGDIDSKDEVRKIGKKLGLEIKDKKDSVGLCFSGGLNYREYLEKEMKSSIKEGLYKDKEGNILGSHKGIIYHTIGQKRGLFIPTSDYRVVDIISDTNTVVLGYEDDLFSTSIKLSNVTLTRPTEFNSLDIEVQYFQWGYFYKAKLLKDNDTYSVDFLEPARAVAIGQHAVFYIGEEIIGGGEITSCS